MAEMTTCQKAIIGEIYEVVDRLGGEPELLALIGSWGDTLRDEDVLAGLKDWNAGRPILHRVQ